MPADLPPRPNLEQLKKQAKELLQAIRAGEPAAVAKFRSLGASAPQQPMVVPPRRRSWPMCSG